MAIKLVVVTGGVISGIGKGVATASIGKILQQHGINVSLIKIDPYINVDAGTLRPTEHGEVWVTDQGGEIDQDLGTYERFMGTDIPKEHNITTGAIYQSVIKKERQGAYLGQTVQYMPHLTNEIMDRITSIARNYDVVVVEVGGTVGDYENIPFLAAIKMLEKQADAIVHVLVTYLPVPAHLKEMKTKPTQQAIRMLGEQSIIPDILICRSEQPLDSVRIQKISAVSPVDPACILTAPDIQSVYQMPLIFENQGLSTQLMKLLHIEHFKPASWTMWQERVDRIIKPTKKVSIAIVGKYIDCGDFRIADSYISIEHALHHAGAALETGVNIVWVDAKTLEDSNVDQKLQHFDGIIIPGGFGAHGVEGKINAITYARTHNVPFLGLCYGFQLAIVEFARNVCSLTDAHTTEVNPTCVHPVVDLLMSQQALLSQGMIGGTMRLGTYTARLKPGSRTAQSYMPHEYQNSQSPLLVHERHRHRYEVNSAYIPTFEKHGLSISGTYTAPDGKVLAEFAELPEHPFFIGTQAHPEFKSRLETPHPLFMGFVKYTALKQHDHYVHAINPVPGLKAVI